MLSEQNVRVYSNQIFNITKNSHHQKPPFPYVSVTAIGTMPPKNPADEREREPNRQWLKAKINHGCHLTFSSREKG